MSNSIVAVVIVVIALSLVAIDLRENLLKKTFYLSLILMLLGLAAAFISINPLFGLAINLFITFFIVYEGCNTYKENMYFPFLLAYLFMALSAPVQLSGLPLRLIALFVGCVYILLIQLVLNHDRFQKTISHAQKQLFAVTLKQLEELLAGITKEASAQAIYPLTKPLVKALYDTRSKSKGLSTENKGRLLIALSLENVYQSLCYFNGADLTSADKNFLTQLKTLLQALDTFLNSVEDKQAAKAHILLLWQTLQTYPKHAHLYPIVCALENLPEALNYISLDTPDLGADRCSLQTFFKPLNRHSATFKFALKLSLSISIIILFANLFHLTYGRWIVFPIIAIVQPYKDGTSKKAFDRILGTVLGIILFVAIFSVVTDSMIRLNITIFLAYINLFVKKYAISTSLIAVSALGCVAMGGAGSEILVLRIICTTVGCLAGLLINQYVFPETLKEYTEDLRKEYEDCIKLLNKASDVPLQDLQKYDLILKSKLLEYQIAQYT